PVALASLKGFVAHEGDAWQLSLDGVGRYYDRIAGQSSLPAEVPLPREPLLDLCAGEVPALAHELIGTHLEAVRLLGARTGELHLAPASRPAAPVSPPEPSTPFYQRSLYQSIRNLTHQTFEHLARAGKHLPAPANAEAERV